MSAQFMQSRISAAEDSVNGAGVGSKEGMAVSVDASR